MKNNNDSLPWWSRLIPFRSFFMRAGIGLNLFSVLYVAGTAVAIASTMVMTMIFYVKIADIYPERNRSRTLYMDVTQYTDKKNGVTNSYCFSRAALDEWILGLKNADIISVQKDNTWSTGKEAGRLDWKNKSEVVSLCVDPNFFRFFEFEFKDGKPFSQEELQGAHPVAVITDELSARLFGSDADAVGRYFRLNFDTLRIVGVVRGGSSLAYRSYANVYVPYTFGLSDFQEEKYKYHGPFRVNMLVSSAKQEKALREEIADAVRRYNLTLEDSCEFSIGMYPISHLQDVFKSEESAFDDDFSWADVVKKYAVILLALLLVPALNLSGMIARRMDSRLPEMGVRKSFGATRDVLLRQVLDENLALTLIGGVIGLVLAWLSLVVFRSWIFSIFDNTSEVVGTSVPMLSGEMLFSPMIFLFAFSVCVVLNLLSAIVPAWLSLRNPIVKSLYEKR